MKISWVIEPEDCEIVRKFVSKHRNKKFVINRIKQNIQGELPKVNRSIFWEGLVMCLLTTQQRSGPESPVTKFLCKKPFPLSLDNCESNGKATHFVEVLQSEEGIRRYNVISKQLSDNLKNLQAGLWQKVEYEIARLSELRASEPKSRDSRDERKAAHFLNDNFKGIGPKQARNLWQYLGLTRYETPLDSRIAKWFSKFGFPIPINAQLLSSSDYYDLALDAVQNLCDKAGVLPCLLDGAIFASYDPDWDENLLN